MSPMKKKVYLVYHRGETSASTYIKRAYTSKKAANEYLQRVKRLASFSTFSITAIPLHGESND